MNGQELKSKLLDLLNGFGKSSDDFVKEEISPAEEKVIVDTIGSYKHDVWEKVYHFVDHDVYLMAVGSYNSEYGIYHADLVLVEPYEYIAKSYRRIT